jgi:nitrite reductase (NADH) small subunit/3-phenylpropionate/trans-cinnamate dioxygenase ferredoxin subunit
MADFVTVASASTFPPGEARTVEVAGRTIALVNAGGTFYALDNTCPHRGGPLGAGFVEERTVTCPWHNWRFDLASGQHVLSGKIRVDTFEVRVSGDDVQVRLP